MIIGIGVDVVDTPRFQGSLVRTPGLNNRLFTEKELNTPGGKPTSSHNLTKYKAVNDVSSAGLKTTVLPAAKAGATFHANINSGKFQGTICPITPRDSCSGY